MRRFIFAGLSVALATGAAACSDNSPSGPDNTPAMGPGTLEQIAFYGASNGASGLTLLNLDGSGLVQLGVGWSPSWSPDGTRLVFSNTQCDTDWLTYLRCDRGGLVIMNPETRAVTTPAAGAFGEDPAWSPTGDAIAFIRLTDAGRRLFLMRLDGSEPKQIDTYGVEVFGPSWSFDGRRIAFQCHQRFIAICVINSDGTGYNRLTASGVSPAWSPDGNRIAFVVPTGGSGEISVMAADGSGVTRLTDGLTPAWSSDNSKLVFSRNNDGLFTINADGSGLTRLTTGIHNSPAWRPKRPSP